MRVLRGTRATRSRGRAQRPAIGSNGIRDGRRTEDSVDSLPPWTVVIPLVQSSWRDCKAASSSRAQAPGGGQARHRETRSSVSGSWSHSRTWFQLATAWLTTFPFALSHAVSGCAQGYYGCKRLAVEGDAPGEEEGLEGEPSVAALVLSEPRGAGKHGALLLHPDAIERLPRGLVGGDGTGDRRLGDRSALAMPLSPPPIEAGPHLRRRRESAVENGSARHVQRDFSGRRSAACWGLDSSCRKG